MKTDLPDVGEMMFRRIAGLDASPPRQAPPSKKILVLSTPRSGSNLFCDSLEGTGKFGWPSEWLHPDMIRAYRIAKKRDGLVLGDYLDFVVRRSTTENGVFSMKLHIGQYMHWKSRGFDPLSLGFDRVFYLWRKDLVSQAYSLAKAGVSGQWRSSLKPLAVVSPGQIGDSMIAAQLAQLMAWLEYYAANLAGSVDRSYCYEEFSADLSGLCSVLGDCGIGHDASEGFAPLTKMQRKPDDLERVEQFRRLLAGLAG